LPPFLLESPKERLTRKRANNPTRGVGGVEDKMKKPTVQERMEQFTSEYQFAQSRRKSKINCIVSLSIYISVTLTSIFYGLGPIFYVVFLFGALAMSYPLWSTLRRLFSKLL